MEDPLDRRFGRAPRFLIYDDENGKNEVIENEQNLNAAQGAGIQSATLLARQNIDCVITGHCGPKAFRVLDAAGIKIYNCSAETVAEAYEQFKAGKLTALTGPDVDSHWM